MTIELPPIVNGVADGDSDAWNRASDLLRDYFVTQNNLSHTFFTLRALDDNPLRIRPVDIVAILALDIGGFRGQREALLNDSDNKIADLLESIPENLDLADASAELLADDGPVDTLWKLLTSEDSFGLKPKVASALVSRKRPRLFPLVLSIQRKVLGAGNNLVHTMRDLSKALQADNGRLSYQLHYLNSAAGISEQLTSLQLLSALLFMDQTMREKEEKAHRKRLKAEKALRKQEEKQQKKQNKKLQKIKAKEEATKARKKEKEERAKLKESVGKDNPISTDAFKLRPGGEKDDQFNFPQQS